MNNQHQSQNQNTNQQQHQQADDENNKITPELLVDALSGHEDGLLSIAERLMTHYDAGYDAMGEAIIDAFADVQKLFQHVVEAAHMEGAALERERGEGEWRKRMENMGLDADYALYGQGVGANGVVNDDNTMLAVDSSRNRDISGEDNNANNNVNNSSSLTPTKSEELRHEELIDQDVRDVLIDAIKRGQTHRDAQRFEECRSLYETSCVAASALLPVDSDHRGRLQLAVARAESMSADRACAILKYAMDDVLRSGLSLRQGKYPQMDIKERSDCVLSRPNPLRTTPSRGYDVSSSWAGGGGGGDGNNTFNSSIFSVGGVDTSTSTVEQSAEEALNSLVEEMKEILAAPVYNLTPLQNVSEKFWLALGEAKKSTVKKEERLEQALAKIKADFLLAREEYEEQLSEEREKVESLKRRFNEMRLHGGGGGGDYGSKDGQSHHSSSHNSHHNQDGGEDLHSPYTPNRPQSAISGGSGGNNTTGGHSYHFSGMDDHTTGSSSHHRQHRTTTKLNSSSSQSVVSLGSEFANKAKSLVHLLNCQGKDPGREPSTRYNNDGSMMQQQQQHQRGGEEFDYGGGI